MVDLQYNIYKLKNNARLNINYLEKQYEELLEDVEYYTTKSEEWGQSIKFVDTSSLLREKKSSVKKLTNKEVRQFLQFVHESGGHENGWNKQDHQVFLKLYSKYAKLDVVAKHVHEILPDITTDEIVCHAEWYKKYLNLKKNQERALLHWKNSKTKIKNVNHNHKIQTQIRSQPILEEDIQAKLQQWKADKESQLLQQIMQEKLEEQKKQELEEKKRKQYNEIKKYIQEWKSNKNEVEEKAKLEKMQIEEHEKRRRAFIANKMIKSFQSQDDMYVMKMKQLQENMKKKPIRSKSSSIGRRDPSRLLKPTEQWIHRVHNDNDQELCNNFLEMPLNCIPKLRIPDWRK